MKYFKVNQTVYDVRHGKGIVVEILDETCANPPTVIVMFGTHRKSVYHIDGKVSTFDQYPSLSHEPWPQAVLNPIIEFEDGELVWVKDSYGYWNVRYYSGMDCNGTHYCYNNQEQSGNTSAWKECRKFDDTPFINK